MSDDKFDVVLARRELGDLVYRSCRVSGCTVGVARRCAANLTHAAIHRSEALECFLEVLAGGAESVRAFARAADVLELAEAQQHLSVEFAAEVPIGAISLAIWQSCERGRCPTAIADTTSATSLVRSIEIVATSPSEARVTASQQREAYALISGITVGLRDFRALEEHASAFLVAEKLIDSAVSG